MPTHTQAIACTSDETAVSFVHDNSTSNIPLFAKNILILNDGTGSAFLTLTDISSTSTGLPVAPVASTSAGYEIKSAESLAVTIQQGHWSACSLICASGSTADVRLLGTA